MFGFNFYCAAGPRRTEFNKGIEQYWGPRTNLGSKARGLSVAMSPEDEGEATAELTLNPARAFDELPVISDSTFRSSKSSKTPHAHVTEAVSEMTVKAEWQLYSSSSLRIGRGWRYLRPISRRGRRVRPSFLRGVRGQVSAAAQRARARLAQFPARRRESLPTVYRRNPLGGGL